jgi:hypothetical protein
MNGMGQEALISDEQTGAAYDMLYNPEDEFRNATIFSEETSISV